MFGRTRKYRQNGVTHCCSLTLPASMGTFKLALHLSKCTSAGKAVCPTVAADAAADLHCEPKHVTAAMALAKRLQPGTLARCQQVLGDDAAKVFRGDFSRADIEMFMLELMDAAQCSEHCTAPAVSTHDR